MASASVGRRVLGLIPARGGSKGLPRKNVLPLLDKPLIGWTIDQARQSRLLTKVHVSTDDQEIAAVAAEFGAAPEFLRPEQLATDKSPIMDTVFYVLDRLTEAGELFDFVALLEPTSPLRNDDDLDSALEQLFSNLHKAEALVSVGEVHTESPFICKVVVDDMVVPFARSEQEIYQRQQLPRVYFPYGVIYASSVSSLRVHKTFYPDKTLPFFLQRWQNYEIDDIYDFVAIESILRKKAEIQEKRIGE